MGYKIDYGKYLELQKNMEELMTQMLEDMAVLEDIERYLWGSKAIQSNAIDAINAYISDKHLETAIPAIKSAFTNFYVVENAYFLEMYNIEEKSDSVIEEEHLKNVEDELTRLKTEVSTFIQNMNAEVNAVSHIINLETKIETDFQDSVDNLISISRKLREDFATYEKNKLLEAKGIEWIIDASIMAIDECNGSSYTMKNYTPRADIELETPEYITRTSTFYNAHQYTDERLDNVLDKKTTQAADDEDIDTNMLNNVVENGYVNKIRQELANVDETEISSDVDSDMDFHNDSDIIEPSIAEDIDDVELNSVVYGELDSMGRATGVEAIITRDMIGTGSPAKSSIKPAGFQGQAQGHARGHLLGNQLGGSGSDPRNLITIYQNPVNHPVMSTIEACVRRAVEEGQIVHYKVVPIYEGDNLIPSGITIEAQGDGGLFIYETILNRK